MPALARLGLFILAIGLFADLAYHSFPELTAARTNVVDLPPSYRFDPASVIVT